MKNLINFFNAVFLALCLITAAGCGSSSPKHASTGEYVDDSVITTKVKSALLNEPGLSSTEINVETFKGEVQLSGFVSSRDDMKRAIELAREVTGVRSVKNDMRLK